MNNVKDIMNGGISAILISIGYIVLLCGIGCMIGFSMGGQTDGTDSILMCSMGCLIISIILIGSGVAWYHTIKPKS